MKKLIALKCLVAKIHLYSRPKSGGYRRLRLQLCNTGFNCRFMENCVTGNARDMKDKCTRHAFLVMLTAQSTALSPYPSFVPHKTPFS